MWPFNRKKVDADAAVLPGRMEQGSVLDLRSSNLKPQTSNLSLPLPRTGRSSIEEPRSLTGSISSYMMGAQALGPAVPTVFIDFLEVASIINFDISNAVSKMVGLSNNGHDLVLADGSDARIEKAQGLLNDLARRAYPLSAGVDGLLNHWFRQLAVSGAISSEAVLEDNLKSIRRVAVVPVRSIRFMLEEGDYAPYQQPSSLLSGVSTKAGMIKLNPETYHYYAAECIEGNPYAIPPMTAAIEPSLIQRDMIENLVYAMKKWGLMGLVQCSLTPPPRKGGESDGEYASRASGYLSDVASAISDNYRDGVMVHFNDQEMKHFNLSGAAGAGAAQVVQMVEQMLISGARMDPSMLGRNYNSTETFSRVVYQAMVKGLDNNRRLVKRMLESFYRLELLLQRASVESVTLRFHPSQGLSPQTDEDAQRIKEDRVLKLMDKGIIDPDQAAQELGYDSAADPERALASGAPGVGSPFGGLFKKVASSQQPVARATRPARTFKWSAALGRYEFSHPRISLATRYLLLATPHGHVHAALEAPSADELEFIAKYLNAIAPAAGDARQAALDGIEELLARGDHYAGDANRFADDAYSIISDAYGGAFEAAGVEAQVAAAVKDAYSFYRLLDNSLWGASGPAVDMAFTGADVRGIEFLSQADNWFISSMVDNPAMQDSVKQFLSDHYLRDGAGIFGRGDPALLDEFRGLFADKLEGLTNAQVQRIVDTSVARSRNWAHIGQLDQAGIATATIVNGANPCDYCRAQAGKEFSITASVNQIAAYTAMSAGEFEDTLRGGPDAWPPYHPNCHCRVAAKV